jgi:hypothetical protein
LVRSKLLAVTPKGQVPGIFAFSQIGEILTVRVPRDGEDWMRLNAREEEQRWNILNSTMAVLSTSRKTKDRLTLEQFQSLVQPTQFLEQVRRTWPMSETQLDGVTSVHEMMLRRLDGLDVCHKGGQKAGGRVHGDDPHRNGEEEGPGDRKGQEIQSF